NVVAAVVAILTFAYVMMNFLVDILYSILDPRIRHGAR
ncbi:MAG: peptide/nickel transport system permease protein, partial [Ilumatobacter sp.]